MNALLFSILFSDELPPHGPWKRATLGIDAEAKKLEKKDRHKLASFIRQWNMIEWTTPHDDTCRSSAWHAPSCHNTFPGRCRIHVHLPKPEANDPWTCATLGINAEAKKIEKKDWDKSVRPFRWPTDCSEHVVVPCFVHGRAPFVRRHQALWQWHWLNEPVFFFPHLEHVVLENGNSNCSECVDALCFVHGRAPFVRWHQGLWQWHRLDEPIFFFPHLEHIVLENGDGVLSPSHPVSGFHAKFEWDENSQLVFSGPVRSSLLALFSKDWDCNWSYFSYISLGLRPDCSSLMNCSPCCSLYRLWTG